ncbi:hypothetical protein JW758_01585 [Candidatus Peregrinibacteria bacterium]|nr:hypothetical protein [Candidatus Peregrinibacteria bacterium]
MTEIEEHKGYSDNLPGKPGHTDKEYVDIIKSDVETEAKYTNDTGEPAKIIYYCRDCEKLVKPKRVGKKLRFTCEECKGSNVAFGSEQSIANFYRIKNIKEKEAEKK